MIVEVSALHSLLENYDLRKGLTAFFEHEALEAKITASEAMAMIPPNPARAAHFASAAKAYEEAMNRLEMYVKENLRKV